MVFRRRDPELLSQYLCYFCARQIVWGAIRRIVRVDPGQPAFELRENYAHDDCLRAALRPEVPLTLRRRWNGKQPMPDDSIEIDGRPCGICGRAIEAGELTRLRIQEPMGAVRRPEFDEESAPVHTACIDALGR